MRCKHASKFSRSRPAAVSALTWALTLALGAVSSPASIANAADDTPSQSSVAPAAALPPAADRGGALYISGLLGAAGINDGVGLRVPLGGSIGYKLRGADLALGPYILVTDLGNEDVVADPARGITAREIDRGSLTHWGLEITQYLDPARSGFHLGGRVGIARLSVPTPGTLESVSATHLSVGPKIGFDSLTEQGLALGGELGAQLVTTEPTLVQVNLLFSAKFWL